MTHQSRAWLPRIAVIAASFAAVLLFTTSETATSIAAGALPSDPKAATIKHDPAFKGREVFIDIDEMRTSPRPHRYVHGGLKGTGLLFSIYMPPKELYKDRFLLWLEGGQGGQDKQLTSAAWKWAFDTAFDDMGAWLVETNEGHSPDSGLGTDNDMDIWRASAEGVRHARKIAAENYGRWEKHGYVYGCSGGGLRSAVHIEKADDIIDGGVAQSFGFGQRTSWSIYGLVGALLGEKLEALKDASDTGGSMDALADTLDAQEADAAKVMFSMGWPRQASTQMKHGWPSTPFSLYSTMDLDPTYFDDFWTKPGYVGHDNPAELKRLLIDTTLTVKHAVTVRELKATPGAMSIYAGADQSETGGGLDNKPAAVLDGWTGDRSKLFVATLTIQSGPDAGKKLHVANFDVPGIKGAVQPFIPRAPYGFNNVKDGDKIKVDNKDFVAFMYYHRYGAGGLTKKLGLQTPQHELMWPEHRGLMTPDGKAKYVQREAAVGWYPGLDGKFAGKMILLNGNADEPIWPTAMTPYERMIKRYHGDKVGDHFRFYQGNHVPHCRGPEEGPQSVHIIDCKGIATQSILDVMHWIEDGTAPVQSTAYEYTEDNDIKTPMTAKDRGGLQPVVKLTANGKENVIKVKAGRAVTFAGSAEAPPKTGTIVRGEWDFESFGTWKDKVAGIDGTSTKVDATATHTYTTPGTYYAALRVASRREGTKGNTEQHLIYDLANVRVVVEK